MLKEYILIGIKDLWRRKGRTILTSLGITIGTLLIVTMVALGTALNDFMVSMVNGEGSAKSIAIQPLKYISEEDQSDIDYQTIYEDYFKKLDDNLINKLKDTGKIESVTAEINYSVNNIKLNDKKYIGNAFIKGYKINETIFSSDNIKSVQKKEKNDDLNPIKLGKIIDEKTGQVVVGERFLENLQINPEDVLDKELEITLDNANGMKIEPITKKFKVVGIIDKSFSGSDGLIMSAQDVAEIKGISTLQKDYFENSGYDNIQIITNNIEDVSEVSQEIKDLDYLYSSTEETSKSINKTLNGLSTGFAVLGVIVLVVAAIGIINTMSMAVLERTKSIGIMKSVGANSSAIRTMFLVQSSIIGFLGGGVGILLASGINSIIQFFVNQKITEQNMMDMQITVGLPWYYILGILLFAGLVALVSGIYPAIKASKLDPIEALRK